MTKFKGTPGKWHAKYNGHYMDIRQENDCLSFASVHVNEYMSIGNSEMEANAKLIAAAPELLEALQEIVGHFAAFTPSEQESKANAESVINKALS
jgi:hypothetical protein